ncbi:C4-dicarboxylic acid transporter DauA [Hydrogenovibrio sp. JE_KL2]|uniref:C4-dicarboxylic acid transporter DauA n=1 Tax=Hydrogenovibrio sp. JE_KL2 TaxID=2651188 RepID=UPI00128CEF1A|nr:C4-dicarboxylic acid transporter DauA [Hydrogenovibrio sp. JE_KL2]MPQ76551.1 C4-dicarboxylic acid transporter DauA [Hydrogenovibrio sp. JE_KL2]
MLQNWFPNLQPFWQSLFNPSDLKSNILAGLTVGIIALPLSMALAIAIDVPPQHGLYTAMIGGVIIALFGGSKINISGPTAAFVVVLLPIVYQYGLGGLLLSGLMAGILLIIMGLTNMGRLIEVVPYPVTVGFTSGIAVVIATLQIKDLLGLPLPTLTGHFIENAGTILQSLPQFHWQETLIGLLTLVSFILWSKLKSYIPPHLIALLVGTLTALALPYFLPHFQVETIGSRFHYVMDSVSGQGIPPFLPEWILPWNQPGADGKPLQLSFELIHDLLGPAITIALLGSIESLLCAVVADGMTGTKHRPNKELIGQGIGNIVVPFFGGIPATAAIARTAASIRSGANSPLASVVHALFVLSAIVFFAPMLSHIPMAALAALLIMVAWNMSEAKHFIRILKIAPRADVAVLLTCFSITVLFDMVMAVSIGMGLAALLFISRSIQLTEVKRWEHQSEHPHLKNVPKEMLVYDINGPLFFGSAQKALHSMATVNPDTKVIVLDMSDVSMLDMSAIMVLETIYSKLQAQKIAIIINHCNERLVLKLQKAGIHKQAGRVGFSQNIEEAIEIANTSMLDPQRE